MRVISGIYKGRKLESISNDKVRPTTDKNKESMFAMIQQKIKESVCLDLFSGSGQLGIEALSNGAKECYFVDINTKYILINLKNLDIKAKIIKKDYIEALKYFYKNNIKFDIVLLDPPYNKKMIDKSVQLIKEHNLLNENGYIICEADKNEVLQIKMDIYKNKSYGNSKVVIYKNKL